jgi:hypothetical protein
MAVPYTFGTSTAAIPLSNLDSNFATTITLGNTAIQLGNTVTTLNNMTLANATVSSLSTPITPAQGGTGLATLTANNVMLGNGTSNVAFVAPGTSGNVLSSNGTTWLSQAASAGTFIANGTSNVSIATSGGNVVVATNGTTALTLSTAQNSTFVGYINAPNTFSFKNRIINGAMVIDQRNAGASVTPTNGQYLVDRFAADVSQASKFTAQQSSTAPAGFANSLLITSSSAYSVGTNDYFTLHQFVEGYNTADFSFGTVNASSITLSFWVRSSLTGTFGGSLRGASNSRSYPFTYTISSANTWEQKTITVVGDTSGTWVTNNGIGIGVFFGLGVGSANSGTAGSWQSINVISATGATSVVGTNGATFYITGVQLEKGSTATSFDVRSYGTELALCQRYFYSSYQSGTAVGTNVGSDKYYYAAINNAGAGLAQVTSILFPVTQRATPTITFYNRAGTSGQWYFGVFGTSESSTSIDSTVISNNAVSPVGSSVPAGSNIGYGYFTASSEL